VHNSNLSGEFPSQEILPTLNSDQWPDYKDGNEDEEKVRIMVIGSFLAILQSFEKMLSLHRLTKTEQTLS
jgi:hypothetical protein